MNVKLCGAVTPNLWWGPSTASPYNIKVLSVQQTSYVFFVGGMWPDLGNQDAGGCRRAVCHLLGTPSRPECSVRLRGRG